MDRRVGWVCAVLLALLAGAAHAQWKWRDAKGQVYVSDLPPPRDVPDKDVLARPDPAQRRAPPPPPAAAASAPAPLLAAASGARGRTDPELEARRRKAEQEEASKTKAEEERQAAARADNCNRARGHLATLESGQRMARVNAQGEREVLDDKARSEEIARARQAIAADCR